ncbi:hypothetical protein EV356DRAFT_573087 [Viridothelium virens]|uniref:25S rRNA adenine-N(1) methyltransferase n=1 Tax=Viridothelium virens TaxID=1048519 RepID=A0A6A6HLY8_VIRVR|nr:hypothetical protein EV356DRAFT_573087 [Viridothelium virens]
MPASNRRRAKSLSNGRPPLSQKTSTSLSSKATRTLIRTHHNLEKAHARALNTGDSSTAETLSAEIQERGGLRLYQRASTIGQSASRGGDSSKILVQWLEELLPSSPAPAPSAPSPLALQSSRNSAPALSLLDVGCLNPENHCARTKLFDHGRGVVRIDLRSAHPLIQQQDFMSRPLPSGDAERFDVLSLSLVLNYVPDPVGRGEMLQRTREFLRVPGDGGDVRGSDGKGGTGMAQKRARVLPCLFLVLPAPCVTNSRYLTEERLEEMMGELGFALVKRKLSAKLVYFLWRYDGSNTTREEKEVFPKKEIRPGRTRNNFCIVLR